MIKLISYIIPVMLNFVFGTILFIVVQRLSEAGVNEFIKGLPLTIWAGVYGALNVVIGKLVTVKNAHRFIMFAGMLVCLCALGIILVPAQNMLFVWMALVGAAFACYCVPFQLFAKGLESSSGSSSSLAAVSKTAGRYTASWSIGLACGPLVSGFSVTGGLYTCMATGLLIALGISFAAAHMPAAESGAADDNSQAADSDIPAKKSAIPDLALLGWIVGGIGTFGISHIRTRLQPLGLANGLSAQALATMLFSVSAVQSLTAFALSLISVRWQFRRLPALLAGGIGVLTLLVFSRAELANYFYFAAAAYGIYTGVFYYYFVFYSLSHPTRASIYTGINEAVVSCNSIISPIIGGFMATISLTCPFLISGLLTAGATVLHVTVLHRAQKKYPEAVK
ncbi:MAG: hypothetical protein IKD22_02680 [Lentisphaeria bacterium]|nr:hypothetical protein [Lentisphaeria bacterium]